MGKRVAKFYTYTRMEKSNITAKKQTDIVKK